MRGDEAKRVSTLVSESKSKPKSSSSGAKAGGIKLSASEKSALVKQLVVHFREALACVKGQVLIVTSTELNGSVTKTLRKCGDAKSAITAFKDSHVELKEIIKAIASAEKKVRVQKKRMKWVSSKIYLMASLSFSLSKFISAQQRSGVDEKAARSDWSLNLKGLRDDSNDEIRLRLVEAMRSMVVAFDHLSPEQVELVAANATDIMSNLDFLAMACVGAVVASSSGGGGGGSGRGKSTSSSSSSSSSSFASDRPRTSTSSSRRETPSLPRSSSSIAREGSRSRDGSRSRVSSGGGGISVSGRLGRKTGGV